MEQVVVSIFAVLGVIYIIPIIVYGIFSAVWGLKTPEGASPLRFLVSVLVSKVGTAVTFVMLFSLAREIFDAQWLLYASIWFVMFVFGEIGQTIGPNYSRKEAIAGIISEALYLPISAFLLHVLI